MEEIGNIIFETIYSNIQVYVEFEELYDEETEKKEVTPKSVTVFPIGASHEEIIAHSNIEDLKDLIGYAVIIGISQSIHWEF